MSKIRHRFSDCPLLPADLRKVLAEEKNEVAFLAGLDELNPPDMNAEIGYARDFVTQLDGWGADKNGLDFLADQPSTHPLASAARRVVQG